MTKPRTHTREALLDAAEELLVEAGCEALTTRRIAGRAGVPSGLVHYHLGTVDALVQALAERLGDRLVAGQRALFAASIPFADRWRAAVLATADPTWAGWMRVRAMSWSRPAIQPAVERAEGEWRRVLGAAVEQAVKDAGVGPAVAEPLAAMAAALLHGIAEERLSGGADGHAAILQWLQGLLLALEEPAPLAM